MNERIRLGDDTLYFEEGGPDKCPRCGMLVDLTRDRIGDSKDADIYEALGLRQVRIRCPACGAEMDFIKK